MNWKEFSRAGETKYSINGGRTESDRDRHGLSGHGIWRGRGDERHPSTAGDRPGMESINWRKGLKEGAAEEGGSEQMHVPGWGG